MILRWLPGTWRVPTLGELRQLANRDSKAPLDGWSFQFADGTYFGCSSSPPDAPPMMYWHLLFPDGETDWGPSNGGDPAVHLACVK